MAKNKNNYVKKYTVKYVGEDSYEVTGANCVLQLHKTPKGNAVTQNGAAVTDVNLKKGAAQAVRRYIEFQSKANGTTPEVA